MAGRPQRLAVALPQLGEDRCGTTVVVPVEFGLAQREDAPQYQLADRLRVGLSVGQRQTRAPRAAEHLPLLDPQHCADLLQIGDQIPGGVGRHLLGRARLRDMRRRGPAAALVEHHDAVALGIEEPTPLGATATARAAVQEDRRLTGRVAALLDIDALAISDIDRRGVVGIDRRVQLAFGHDPEFLRRNSHDTILGSTDLVCGRRCSRRGPQYLCGCGERPLSRPTDRRASRTSAEQSASGRAAGSAHRRPRPR
ncbi:hypothetical protein SDC9_103660 [bioreactor metagenome]|uniref:Uncharacterized protein n=1 Tax=bioreactor metagenome TaxID=1076179 RepID=A0A645B548_9ZZZZ